jgi:hypothetical protein
MHRAAPVRAASVSSVAMDMRRVASAMLPIDRAENSRLDRDVADRESDVVGVLTAIPPGVFTVVCVTGAGAVAVGFGAADPLAVLVAAVSTAVGG